MKFKKGKKYKCVDWGGVLFTVGEVYFCKKDGCLTDNEGFNDETTEGFGVFKKAPSKKSLKKRIKALEKIVQKERLLFGTWGIDNTYPTSAFKAIEESNRPSQIINRTAQSMGGYQIQQVKRGQFPHGMVRL